jgi:hypothetical protein
MMRQIPESDEYCDAVRAVADSLNGRGLSGEQQASALLATLVALIISIEGEVRHVVVTVDGDAMFSWSAQEGRQ